MQLVGGLRLGDRRDDRRLSFVTFATNYKNFRPRTLKDRTNSLKSCRPPVADSLPNCDCGSHCQGNRFVAG
jgi:hypothetical protein